MPRKNLDIDNGTFNLTRTEMSTLARWHLTCAQTLVNVFTFNEEQLKEYQHHIAQSVKFAEAVARRVDKMQRLEEAAKQKEAVDDNTPGA